MIMFGAQSRSRQCLVLYLCALLQPVLDPAPRMFRLSFKHGSRSITDWGTTINANTDTVHFRQARKADSMFRDQLNLR